MTINKEPREDIASDFVGQWSGKVIQTGSHEDKYPVVLTIWQGAIDECVGTVDYATAGCGADLFLVAATSLRISVEERLTSGLTKCVDRSVITLTKNADGALMYNASVADLTASAVLKKASH